MKPWPTTTEIMKSIKKLEDELEKDEMITTFAGWYVHPRTIRDKHHWMGYSYSAPNVGGTRIIPNGWKFNQLTRQYEVKKKAFVPNDEE